MTKPAIILVHGALAGGSIWGGVTERLQAQGYTVHVPAMPLRSLEGDIAYLAAFVATVGGPVVLAGHSYGGTIISAPEFANEDTAGLVFVAGFAPDSNESTGELNGRWAGSKLTEATTVTRAHPDGTDLYLKPECFEEVYAGGLPTATISRMAASQRPIDVAALGGSFSGEPAWKSRPSYFLISTEDASLVPEAQHAMANRAGAVVATAAAAHASPVSHPDEVVTLIVRAADQN